MAREFILYFVIKNGNKIFDIGNTNLKYGNVHQIHSDRESHTYLHIYSLNTVEIELHSHFTYKAICF